MIVADANLLIYLMLPGARTQEAEAVLIQDPVWAVPKLCSSELRSVLSQYIRRGQLSLSQALTALQRAEHVIAGREASVESRMVLELSQSSKCSSYDCEYVALAMMLGLPLVTADGALLRAFPRIAVSPTVFAPPP